MALLVTARTLTVMQRVLGPTRKPHFPKLPVITNNNNNNDNDNNNNNNNNNISIIKRNSNYLSIL